MPSRKTHRKSHLGCTLCKFRRIKCDETYPQCLRCVKRSVQCSFAEDSSQGASKPLQVPSRTHPVTSTQVNAASTSEADVLTPQHIPASVEESKSVAAKDSNSGYRNREVPNHVSTFDILDIELVHYFSTRTYITLSSRLSSHSVWRDEIFKQALKHNFLLRGIMATAALHKAATTPMSAEQYAEYARVALAHQDAALASYIPAVTTPNEDNSIALFVLSLLLTIWGFASRRLPEGLVRVKPENDVAESQMQIRLPPHSPIADFIDIIMTIRGIWPVLRETGRWLQGEIEELIRYPRDSDLPPHPADVQVAFDVLAQATAKFEGRPDRYDPHHRATRALCLEYVQTLRDISRCRSVVEWDGHILSWLMMGPPEFITCLKQGNEMALASFAYWAAMFRCMDHHWWAKGWSYSLVVNVCELLGPHWQHVLGWPRKQVGM